MPSTYTTSLRLTLPATGELAGTWGTTVNAGVTSLAEAAIAGTAAVTMIDADYTLTAVNGAADQARNMFVTLTGTLSTARNVICPPVSKLYFVTNNTTGGYAITFKTLAGTGISVPNGQRAVVYCNGTDVLGGLTALDSLSLNGSLTLVGGTANGVLYLNGSKAVTSGSALTFNGTNLGVGVTSPSQKLDILGGIAVRAATSGANQDIIALRALNSDNTAYANAIYYANSHRWAYAGATEGMRLDSSGNLGLGVTPTYKLDVYGTGSQTVAVRAATSGDARFYAECAGTNSGWMQYTRSLQALQWSANGATQHMTLDSSGNLGLGVTPSAWISNTKAAQIGSFLSAWTGSNGSANISFAAYEGVAINTYRYLTTGDAPTMYSQLTGAHRWYTAPSGTAGNAITFTQAMTLDASSNLLVTGYGRFGGSLGYIGKSSDLVTGGAATDTALRYDGNNLVFAYSSTERMRLDSSGNLGLGVTPSAWGNGASLQGAGWSLSTLLGFDQSAMYTNARQTAYGGFGSNWVYRGTASATGYAQSSGSHVWLTAPSGTAGTAITFTQAMTLDASGNLGLGVTPSAWSGFKAIQVGNGAFGDTAGASNNALFGSNTYYNGAAFTYINTTTATLYRQLSGQHQWYTAPSGTAGNPISFTQAMTLDASGNLSLQTGKYVGNNSFGRFWLQPGQSIGTASFAGLYGAATTYNAKYDGGWKSIGGGTAGAITIDEGIFSFSSSQTVGAADVALTWTTRMVVDTSGNLGIGTSSPIAVTGTTVDVAGASGASQRWRNNAGTSSAYLEVAAGVTNFGNAVSTPLAFVTAATERMRLDTSGNLGIGTTSPDVFSRGDTRTVGVSSSGTSSIGINAATGNAASLYVGVNGTRSGQIVGSSAGLEVIAGSSLPLSLGANFSTRVTISSAGDVGVGTTSPTSTLHVSGSFSRGVPVTKTSNFTLAATENWIINAGSGAITCTLPAASSCPGREVYFSSQTSSGATNILSSATNIALLTSGGLSSTILDNTGLGFRWVTIVSDGTNWVQVMRGS